MAKQEKRKYQERDLKDIILKVDSGKNVMYQLPTGGGKSVVASDFVHNYHTEEVLILAHRRELILQMEDRLSSDKIIPGVIVGDIQRNLDSNILIGSVQTLSKSKRLETILNTPRKLVIVDEAHRLRTPSYDKILNHLREVNPDIRIVGLSATPWRADKKDFREYIDELICSETVDSLIKEGYLCNFRTYVTNIGDIDKEVEKNENDYNIASLSKYMRQDVFLQHAVDQYKEKGENRQALIFAVDKLHLKAIIEKFKSNGFDSIKEIHAETPQKERDLALEEYRRGELKFIVSIDTMIEGVDLPETGCLIVLRPTESLVVFHQLLGRGMRRKSDGSDLIILDCAGVTKKHGAVNSPRTWSLDPNVDPKQNTRRNKIVGKRKDGSYSDDLEEIETGDLEVVEMTPEEYLLHSSNAIEEAEEYNKKVETEVESMFRSLVEEFGKLIQLLGLSIEAEVSRDRYNERNLELSFEKSIGKGYGVRFQKNGKFLIPEIVKPWSGDDPLKTLKINEVVGKLSGEMLTNQKHFTRYEEVQKQVEQLREAKIDINSIKKQREQFELEQLEINVNKMLVISKSLYAVKTKDFIERELKEKQERKSTGRYWYGGSQKWMFPVGSEVSSCYSDFCDEIYLEKGKLLGWNTVIFKTNGREVHRMSALEKHRLLNILKGEGVVISTQAQQLENN